MKWLARLRHLASPEGKTLRRWQRAAQGHVQELERIYAEHVDELYTFVFYRVGRDASLAEEVVQETFALALEQIARFDPERGSLETWLRTLSRNVIRDHLRAHRRGADLVARWEQIDSTLAGIFAALDHQPLSDEVLAQAETGDLVNMTLAQLPEHYRAVLEARYVAGENLQTLGARLKLGPEATKSLLHRARLAFREAFTTLSRSFLEEVP